MRNLVFLLILITSHVLAETAAFDPATNVLTVPSVQINTQLYSTTQVALPANGKWAVVGIGAEGVSHTADTAVFDLNTQVLMLPSLRVGPRLYSTSQVALPADGQWAAVSVGAERAAPASTLAVTPTSISGKTGDNIKFTISGGNSPYSVTSNNYKVASAGAAEKAVTYYSTTPPGTAPQAESTVYFGVKGAAQIQVTDAAGNTMPVSAISAGGGASSEFAVSPVSITGRPGETAKFIISGGTPPYYVFSNNSNVAKNATSSSDYYYSTSPADTIPQAEATIIMGSQGVAQIQVRDATYSSTKVVSVSVTNSASTGTSSTTTADRDVCWEIPPTYNYGTYDYNGKISPFTISPAAITASANESLTLAVGGGTPPYSIISTRSTIATATLSPGANRCQATATISTLTAGAVMIIATDGVGKQVSATITVTVNDVKITPFAVSPATVTTRMGEPIMINIVGGKPPYRVSSSREFVANPDSGTYYSTTPSSDAPQAEAVLRTHSSGDATITISDADGSQKTVTVTVSALPFGVSPATATARSGEPVKVTIAGGRPPYRLSTSNSFIAYPDSGIYDTGMTWAEATIRTRSPGTATITINDSDGHQTTVTISVTR